jgi:hypothetical protein
MIYAYIVDSTATQVYSGNVKKAIIQVNAALTGSIKVIDGTGGTTANVATITNPTVGSIYEYWGLQNGLRVIASTTCDITASADLSRAGA